MAGLTLDEFNGEERWSAEWWRGAVKRLPRSKPSALGDVILPRGFVIARWTFLTVAALCVWLIAFSFVFSGIEEHRAQHTLYAKLRETLASGEHPVPIGTTGVIGHGTAVALINAPEVGLHNVVIVEGTTSSDLRKGPGHKRDTPLPGQPGTSEVFGRSTTFGGPFADVPRLQPGDHFTVTTGQGVLEYSVNAIRHSGDPVTEPAVGTSRLTLVTSQGSGWRSGWAPSRTVYVDAALQGGPKPATDGRPNYSVANEGVMHSDTSGLLALVLWLEVFVVVIVGAIWASRRWGEVPSWTVGGVSALAVLWVMTDVSSGLLPNLV